MAIIDCVELSFCTMNQHFVVHFVLLFVCTRTFAVRMSRLRKVNFILLPAIEMRKYSPPDESDLWKTQILVTLLLSSPWNSLKTAVSSVGWPGDEGGPSDQSLFLLLPLHSHPEPQGLRSLSSRVNLLSVSQTHKAFFFFFFPKFTYMSRSLIHSFQIFSRLTPSSSVFRLSITSSKRPSLTPIFPPIQDSPLVILIRPCTLPSRHLLQ